MAFARKGRRTIVVGGRTYLWWIADDEVHSQGSSLCAFVADDETPLLFTYQLGQPAETAHVTVKRDGRVSSQGWYRVRAPVFGSADSFTPSAVRSLLDWFLASSLTAGETDYTGASTSAHANMRRGSAPKPTRPSRKRP